MNVTTPAGASAYAQSRLSDQIGSAVAVLARNAQRRAGDNVLKMLAAATVGRGPAAAANGVGGTLDVTG